MIVNVITKDDIKCMWSKDFRVMRKIMKKDSSRESSLKCEKNPISLKNC